MADGVVEGWVGEGWCFGAEEEGEYEWLILWFFFLLLFWVSGVGL